MCFFATPNAVSACAAVCASASPKTLRFRPQETPESRAALSLLGHCYFQTDEFELASQM
jgi:hypothetical protein